MLEKYNLPDSIKSEFEVEEDGKVYAKSIRAVARLCGVEHTTILRGGAFANQQLAEKLTQQGFDLNELVQSTGESIKIPDVAVGLIIEYYALEARIPSQQAKSVLLSFGVIGFRTFMQQQLGWNKPVFNKLTLLESLKLNLELEEKRLALESKINQDAPKVAFYDEIIDMPDCVDMAQAAQLLKIPYKQGYVGRTLLFRILREANIFNSINRPYQSYVNKGYFKLTEVVYETKMSKKNIYVKTMITNKGLEFIKREVSIWLE